MVGGTLQTPEGEPLAQATVEVEFAEPSCRQTAPEPATTDEEGGFTAVIAYATEGRCVPTPLILLALLSGGFLPEPQCDTLELTIDANQSPVSMQITMARDTIMPHDIGATVHLGTITVENAESTGE